MLDLGQPITLTTSPVDVDNNSVDITGLKVVVRLPDSSTTGDIDPVHDSTGAYSYEYTPAQAGRYSVRWHGTGWAYTDTFDVWPANPRFLISLADARAAIRTTYTGNDEKLRLYIAAATPVIEDITGPLITEQRTRTFDGNAPAVLLEGAVDPDTVTVTENGQQITDFNANAAAGIVYAGLSLAPRMFFPGRQNVTVTYTVGVSAIPENVLLAAAEEVRFLWQVGQEGQGLGIGELPDDVALTPSGYYTFRRVLELCAATPRLPGFA